MPEMSTAELYRYRAHYTPQELYEFRRLQRQIEADGVVKEALQLATDGTYAVLEDGHKRVMIAIELGIKRLPVTIVQRKFGPKRKMKCLIGPELATLLSEPENPDPEPE